MPVLTVPLEFPSAIIAGLSDGRYERIGGVIQEAGSKHVVTWLREGAQIANNSNLAGGVLKSLLNVSSGGGASIATGAIDAVVSAHRHNQIMQELRVIQGITTVAATASVVGIAVQIASTLYLVHRINQLHKSIVNEFEHDRRNRLESAIEYVEKIVPKLEGERKNVAVEGVSREIIGARNDLRWKFDEILTSQHLTVEQTELASKILQQAMQLDTAHIRIYLETEQVDLAKNLLGDSLVEYRNRTQLLIQDLLGAYPARYFNSKVDDKDLLRYVLIEEWLREQKDILLDIVLENRKDFWNGDVNKTIGPDKRDLRGFTFIGHREALSYAEVLIENYKRLLGHQAEIEAVERLGITYPEWEKQQEEALAKAKINLAEHDDYVILVDEEWLSQQSDSTAA